MGRALVIIDTLLAALLKRGLKVREARKDRRLAVASGHVGSVVGSFRVRAVDTKRYYAGYDASPKLMHEVHVH